MSKLLALVVLIITSAYPLRSQIDIRSNSIYIVNNGKIFKIMQGTPALLMPCYTMATNPPPGKIYKYGNESVWLGDGKKILYKPCKSGASGKVKLPDGLIGYSNFEILENGRVCIWAPSWATEKGEPKPVVVGAEYPKGLIVDPETGKVEFEFEKIKITPDFGFYDAVILSEILTSTLENHLVLAGKYTGRLMLYEMASGKTREIEVIREEDLPPKGQQRVDNGPSITQLIPLPWGDLLIGLRQWLPAKGDVPARWFDCFRVLNVSEFTLGEPELSYEGIGPNGQSFWVDWDRKPHLLDTLEKDRSGEGMDHSNRPK